MEESDNSGNDPALGPEALARLYRDLHELRQELLAAEAEIEGFLEQVHPDNHASARNLAHYVALRRFDIRGLQLRLARAGLSSLGRSESHVLVTIDRIIAMLALAGGIPPPRTTPAPVGFREGEQILESNARRLLGRPPPNRTVRVVVTLSSEVAEDPAIASELIAAGMDCARINCARDDPAVWAAMARNVRAAQAAHGSDCRILVDLHGPKMRTGGIAGGAEHLLLSIGDQLEVVHEAGEIGARSESMPRIACAARAVFQDTAVGQPIWFDDGKIGGIIDERTMDRLVVRVTHARSGGGKLRPDRGINLPETALTLTSPTPEDLRDLEEVVGWADSIEQSFVQRPSDMLALHDALTRLGADQLGVVLKIETRAGFEAIPQLLMTAMRRRIYGVMIARGDLAVEVGFERMAEIQEEILWIAEAAHAPTIWATEVLDDLASKGTLSRPEMTDAAMSARAEAVMLNKGDFVLDAIRTLDDILARMKEHQSKKRSLFRALHVSGNLWT